MDPLDILPVRFHFGGEFDFDGNSLNYIRGRVELSHIERDKLSLPELRGFLSDHVALAQEDHVEFHWLSPGAELSSGLRALADDKICMLMSDSITNGEVAEVYVEIYKVTDGDNVVMWTCDGPAAVMPVHCSQQIVQDEQGSECSSDNEESGDNREQEDSDSDDSDYVQGNDDTSEHDEEAQEFREHARNVKKNPCATKVVGAPKASKVQVEESDEGDGLQREEAYMDSSEEASYSDDENGEAIRRKSKYPRFDNNAEKPKFTVGMTFGGRKEFKSALIKYGLAMKRHLRFPKDEKYRIRARCSWNGCPWFIYGSKRTNCQWFQVKTYHDVHICPKRRDNRLVTSTRIADKYEHIIRANPSWKIQNIKETVQLDTFADVSISKVKRAKGIVMKRIYEACKGEYSKVFEYQAEILRSNPGSTVAVCLDPEYSYPVFQRIYICFDACKKGFKAGCRKVVGLDGCFFKGACNGELICALGRDSNNQIYPIAWAVVEKETEDSWEWFLGLVQKDLQMAKDGAGWVLISDQQKGLLNAVRKLFPEVEHRMCTRHIYANWRKKYRDQAYQKPFWQCAKASSVINFNFCKALLAQLTPAGAKDMMSTNPKHWSRAWFNIGSNCDSVDNNMCESFNNWIIDVRAHPIISMLEGIRIKVYVRIQQNRSKTANWKGRICPNILKKLNKYIDQAGNCVAIWNGKDGFEVKDNDKRYKVDIEARTCSCRYWQLAGIPCPHAITALFVSSKPPEDYIADCYSVDLYNKIYDHCMMPMEGMQQWAPTDHPKPGPPAYVKMPGRPRKERRREPGETKKGTKLSKVGTITKCSRCKGTNHNVRTCKMNRTGDRLRSVMEKGKEVQECSRPQKKPRKNTGNSRTSVEHEMTPQSSLNTSSAKGKKAAAKGKKTSRATQ
ncbi:hypothetical protein ACP70R_008010 [Stipagrostis hirtigluma subsp. patula]